LALGLRRLHLVANWLLGRRDHFGRAALRLDLLGCRLRKVGRLYRQLLTQLAVAQNTYTIGGSPGKTGFCPRGPVDRRAVRKGVQVADVDDVEGPRPGGVGEAALGNPAEERHLAALKVEPEMPGAGAGPLPLGAAAGSLAVARADAPADSLAALVLV